MSSMQTQAKTLELNKLINAPVDRVFKAWTEPDQISKWFGCNQIGNVQVEQDLRVGGQYKIEAIHCADNKPAELTGTFKEIVPNKKLVYTWTNNSEEFPAKDTLVTVEFIDKGNSTEVIIKHTNFAVPESVPPHNLGWGESLNKLAQMFKGE